MFVYDRESGGERGRQEGTREEGSTERRQGSRRCGVGREALGQRAMRERLSEYLEKVFWKFGFRKSVISKVGPAVGPGAR